MLERALAVIRHQRESQDPVTRSPSPMEWHVVLEVPSAMGEATEETVTVTLAELFDLHTIDEVRRAARDASERE